MNRRCRSCGTPRQIELVHRLLVQPRSQSLPCGSFPAIGEHVGRDVAAVDVQTGAQQRKQQTPRAAGEIEGRLTIVLDDAAVEGELVRDRVR